MAKYFTVSKGDAMPEFWGEFLTLLKPLAISAVLGTVIGAERHYGRKPAGLRTHVLVCLGSTMFILSAKYAVSTIGGQNLDPTRVVHGVITGVGFLGAGAIFRHSSNIHGLTTAASIWMVAAIGVAVGLEALALSVAGTVMAMVVLVGFRWFEHIIPEREEGDEVNVKKHKQ